jgi:hypothetical protein
VNLPSADALGWRRARGAAMLERYLAGYLVELDRRAPDQPADLQDYSSLSRLIYASLWRRLLLAPGLLAESLELASECGLDLAGHRELVRREQCR